MGDKIKILHLEDSPSDAGLIARELKNGKVNCEILVVDTKEKFEKALDDLGPDIILCDNSVPSLDSSSALTLVREKALTIPLIIVTATMSEEFAVNVMKQGAADYVFKDRLHRLPEAILGALEKWQLKEAQQLSEKRFRVLTERSTDMKSLTTLDGRVLYASPATSRILGYTLEEIRSMNVSSFIHPDDAMTPDVAAVLLEADGNSIRLQQRMLHKLGNWIWVEGTLTNMLNEPGIHAFVSNFRDVSERKKAEEQREFDKNNMDALINNTRDLMWSVDMDLKLIVANRPFDEAIQLYMGRTIAKGESVILPELPEGILKGQMECYRRALAGKETTIVDHLDDPVEIWGEVSYTPIRNNNVVIGIACHSRIITELKVAERLIKKSEAFSRGVLNSLSSHIAVVKDDGTIVAVNESWTRFSRENGETILQRTGVGSNYFQVCERSVEMDEDMAVTAMEGMRGVIDGKETCFYLEYPCHSPVEKRWFGMRVLKFDGDESLVVVAHQNITERKLAEEGLIESETRLKEAQAIAKMGNWQIDMTTGTHFWSEGFYAIYGADREEVSPSEAAFMSFIHPEDVASVSSIMAETFRTLSAPSFDFKFIRNDGAVRFGHSEARFEFDAERSPIRLYGILQDVTEQKNAEEIMLNTKALLIEAQKLAKMGNWNFDTVSSSFYWSEGMKVMHGLPLDHSPDPGTIMSVLHPDDMERIMEEMMRSRSTGEEIRSTYRIIRADTQEVRTMQATTGVELDAVGNFARVFGIVEDITELHRAEQERDALIDDLEQRVTDRTLELTLKNKDILDSIIYAKRIQSGLLSPESDLIAMFPNSFTLASPRDIVSGDFFWVLERNDRKFIVVADCTGHGVPGALMSVIGNNLLNQIIIEEHFENPSVILQQLDTRLKDAVKGGHGEVRDGMDIVLCMIDNGFHELYYAGAYRPLFISNADGTISELLPDRQSIGGSMMEEKKHFVTKRMPIVPKQRIYLTSDGYYSQFGGPNNKKFMKSRFIQTLQDIQGHTMAEQKQLLRTALIEWQGDHEQVDDVLVVGLEL